MKAVITLTSKKTYIMDYPDNDFSDEILSSNFWLYEFDDNAFIEVAEINIERTDIDEVVED